MLEFSKIKVDKKKISLNFRVLRALKIMREGVAFLFCLCVLWSNKLFALLISYKYVFFVSSPQKKYYPQKTTRCMCPIITLMQKNIYLGSLSFAWVSVARLTCWIRFFLSFFSFLKKNMRVACTHIRHVEIVKAQQKIQSFTVTNSNAHIQYKNYKIHNDMMSNSGMEHTASKKEKKYKCSVL